MIQLSKKTLLLLEADEDLNAAEALYDWFMLDMTNPTDKFLAYYENRLDKIYLINFDWINRQAQKKEERAMEKNTEKTEKKGWQNANDLIDLIRSNLAAAKQWIKYIGKRQ